jgi:hypothetical protein
MAASFNTAPYPWRLDNIGDSTHDTFEEVYPQHIDVIRIIIYPPTADGNVMILDTDGADSRWTTAKKTIEDTNPRIIFNDEIDSTELPRVVELNGRVRGIHIEDIPAGAYIEVFYGVA